MTKEEIIAFQTDKLNTAHELIRMFRAQLLAAERMESEARLALFRLGAKRGKKTVVLSQEQKEKLQRQLRV